MQYNSSNIDVIERVIRTYMNNNGSAYEAIVGLHNAMAHGDVLFDNGFEFNELDFSLMMLHLREAATLAQKFTK